MSTLDGIPVGTIRSNLSWSKISPEHWCKAVGHKFRTDKDGEIYCSNCWKTLDELNRETYEQTKTGTD